MKGLIVAVIGAGSTYTPEMIEGFLKRQNSLPLAELRLMDIDQEKLRIVGALVERMLHDLPCKLSFCSSLDQALPSADFVLTQIRVGGLKARMLDETIPLKYGLLGQETTGIGGMFKALRTIPVVLAIAQRMEELCPRAFLINFTNPAGMVSEAVLKHSRIRTIGLCNVPWHMLKEAQALLPPEAKTSTISYMGLNHLSWISRLEADGVDYLPAALKSSAALYRPRNNPEIGGPGQDLGTIIGGIPSSYLDYYYQRNAMVEKIKNTKESRAEVCMGLEAQLLELYSNPELREKPAILAQRGGAYYSEVAVSLMEAIANDSSAILVANVSNGSTMDWLRPDDVVELPCRVDRNGASPLPLTHRGNEHMRGLMQTVKAYERLAIESAVEGSRQKAIQALLLHPLCGDYQASADCFDALLAAHKPYLGQFFQGDQKP